MAQKFEIEKATAQPEKLQLPSPIIAIQSQSTRPKRVKQISSISLIKALRMADLVKLNARDLESGIAEQFRPSKNSSNVIISDTDLATEYDDYAFEVLRVGRTPMSFAEYNSYRDPSAWPRFFIALCESLGIENTLTQDLA